MLIPFLAVAVRWNGACGCVMCGSLTSVCGNNIATFDDIQPLAALGQSLETVYLEYNPVQEDDPLYRKKLKELIPSLTQIDANLITTANLLPPTTSSSSSTRSTLVKSAMAQNPVAAVPGETEEERLRRLQEAVIQRARQETAAQRPTRTAATTTTTTTTPPSTLTGDDDNDDNSDSSSPWQGDGQPGDPLSSTTAK